MMTEMILLLQKGGGRGREGERKEFNLYGEKALEGREQTTTMSERGTGFSEKSNIW